MTGSHIIHMPRMYPKKKPLKVVGPRLKTTEFLGGGVRILEKFTMFSRFLSARSLAEDLLIAIEQREQNPVMT